MADRHDQQAAEELRELIREGHGLLKDLRAERRAVEQLLDGIGDRVDARIDDAVKTSVEKLGESTRAAMDNAVAKVGREFDRLEQIFLGTDRESRRAGKQPLEDLIRQQVPALAAPAGWPRIAPDQSGTARNKPDHNGPIRSRPDGTGHDRTRPETTG